MPSTAHEEYLSEQGTWIGVHEKSRVKVILVEEHGAMVLGDHMEVLRQGTVSDESKPFVYANHMPRPVEVACQSARVRSPCRARVPRQDLQLVGQTSAALI